jgi:hypothetical protein
MLLVIVFILNTLMLSAQRECTSHTYNKQEKASNLSTANNIARAEAFVHYQSLSTSSSIANRVTAVNTIKIPVVIHVLYNNAAQNISDAQIQSQLKVLNDDFRRRNSDTVNTPDRFKSFAADVAIEFVLATADPKGRATSGIVRKKTSVLDWGLDDKIKFSAQGGDDAWDAKSYLNIWVGNMRKVLGYSSVPGSAIEKDGVVITANAFGTINTIAPYHLGRTAVHEVGHWLGLKHIWGDAACGDDGIQDTPQQSSYTTGCPTGFRSSCNNGSLGDMYMNYMDFTNDACLNLFTEGQKNAMRSLFAAGGPRVSILASKSLNESWLEEILLPVVEVKEPIVISTYPNPAVNEVTINFAGDNSWIGKELRIVSSNGFTVLNLEVTSTVQKINTTSLKPGVYMISGVNGGKKMTQKFIKL